MLQTLSRPLQSPLRSPFSGGVCPDSRVVLRDTSDLEALLSSGFRAFLNEDFEVTDTVALSLIANDTEAATILIEQPDILERIAANTVLLQVWLDGVAAKAVMMEGATDWASTSALDRVMGVSGAYEYLLSNSLQITGATLSNPVTVNAKVIILSASSDSYVRISNYTNTTPYYYTPTPFTGWKVMNGFTASSNSSAPVTTVNYLNMGARTV